MSILQDAIKKKNEEMGKATSPSSTQSKSILSAAIQTKKETGKLPAASVPVKKQEKTSYQETMQQAETALQKKATLQSERDRLKSELGELNRTKYNLTTTDRTYQVRAAGGDNEENRKRKDLEEQLAAIEKEIQQLEYVDQYEGKTYEDNFPGQFAANKDLGRITQDVNAAYSKYLMEPTQANKEYADALAKLAEDFQVKNSAALDEENARWALVSKTLAGYIPQLVDQTKAQATGAVVGGAAGSVVPVLGTVAGAKAGMVIASGAQSYNQMRGAAFRELLAAGMDEETARAAANDEAILSSLIEMADTGVDLATLGTGKLLTMLGKGGVKAAAGEAAETAGKKFVKALAKYGVNVGSEMAQEGAQQAISIGNRERSGTGMGDLAKSAVETARGALTGENKEAAAEIMEAAKEGGKIAALMGGATMAATGIANNALGKKAKANAGEIKAAGETETQGNISTQPEAAKEAAQSETGEAAAQTQDALAEYPNLQKAAKGETDVDANEVAREAAAAVQQGAITREEGRELTRQAIASAKARQEAAAQVQKNAAAAEERAPGYYGNAEDPDAAYLDRLGKAAGVSIEKVPAAQAGNREGWIIGGRVYLAEGAEDVQRIVAKHEVTHQLQEMAPEAYENFRSYVKQIYRQRGTLEQQIEGLTNLYRENNQELTAEGALDELTANYAGELMENENLIRRLAGEDRSLGQQILDAIREILRRMRAAFGDQETRQLERAARLWEKALVETNEAYYQQGKRSENGQARNSFKGYAEDGRGIYESNFPKGTPKSAKAQRILEYIQNVWSKKPIKLVVQNENGTQRIIEAKFDPTYDPSGNTPSDATKLMGGNRHGNATEKRVTLDLADDYYQIASESAYNYSKNETGKTLETHKDVKEWHYFVNDILFQEYGETKTTPYRVTINVKERSDGEYVYSFNAEQEAEKTERPSTRRTLHADGNQSENGEADAQPYVISVARERSSVKGARELQKMIDSGALKTYEQITDAQNGLYQQERELADRKRAAVNNPELTKAMDEYSGMFNEMRELLPKRRNGTATQAELDRIEEIKTLREEKMAEIVDLQEQLGLKEIEEETAIRETKEQLRVAADEAWEREGAEKENAAIEKAGVSSADYFRKKALKAFKTTTNFNEAGYLLPDGKMLNFSGGERNHRYRDHREIGEIYEATNGVKALNRFLADGNIRVMAESPGIDLAAGVEPTYEQYAVLKKFINSNGKKEGKFFVDFSGKDGRREGNYSYTNGVNADRIINDIKYYYETGKIREQSAVSMFHERDSVKGARELQQQIDRLTKQNKRLQAQMKISNMPKASRKAVEQQATELRKAYGSNMDKAELTERLEKLYEGMYAQSGGKGRKTMSWEDIRTEARSIADAILAEATGNVNPKAEEYAQLRKELRAKKISISERDRADLDSMGGYNELRKRNMGSLTLSKEGTPVDIVYQELSDQYPELFPDDIYHPADQLMRISDVVQELKVVEGNPYEKDMENTAAYLAGEIEERFYDTPTEVEALESQLSRQFEKQRRKERDANSRRLLQQQAAHEQVIRDMEERIREENRKRIANQSASERRETIRRHADRLGRKLIRPTDKSHVPAEMRGAALALVQYIDTESGYELSYGPGAKYRRVEPGTELDAEITSRTAAARELQAEYKKLSEDTTLTIDPDMADYLDEIARMGNKRVADMTRAELDTVWKVMQVIEHTIGQANDLLEESRYRNLQEMANALKRENEGKKDRVDRAGMMGEGDKLLNLDMLTPETYFSRLGNAGNDIFRQMRKAADRQTEILKEGTDRARKLIEESGVSFAKADKEMHTFEVKGGEITLSTGQLMELYALSKRQQAMEHIYEGGLKPVDATVKGKIIGGSKPVKVTPGDVAEMVSALTKEQRELVDGLQKYLSGDLARHGNEESRKVYGYDKFLEKNYWPIKVSSTEVASDPGKAATAKTIPGYGMTKALKPKANNAVELRSAIDTYSRHLNQMATYAAWLGTNENVTRLQNFKFETADGQPDGNVKQLIEKVYGKGGNDYLQNLLSDIAQGTKAGADRSLAERGLSQFKAAKVGGNLRVIIQQPTAILRAMEMVDPKYFASGKTTSGKGWEKAVKYAPIAQWKDWGYFEMDTGMSLRELMTGTENKLDKVKNALMAPAGAADSVAWGYLWNAVEAETADTHPELQKGTEAFYRAVADRFSEVVDHTQVVDSVLHRSQIMRSSNYLSKVSTSFMSEPMKVYNMVVRDLYDLRSATGEEARKKAGKKLGKTAAALVTSFAVNALAQSIVDGMRDDDREKKYMDKVADQWLENFTENFNPIGYIPYLKDAQSLLQGYTLERSEMEGVAELITSMQNLWKAKEGESQKTVLAAGLEAASKLGDLLGLPVSNLKRDAEALVRTVMISAGASKALYEWDKKVYNPEKAMGKFYDDMYRAMDTDQDTYEMIYDDVLGMLQEQGMDADEAAGKIKSNVENRMKKELGLDKTSSLPVRYSAPGEDDVFDELMREAEADGGSWAEAFGEETVEMARELDAMEDATKVQRVAQIGVMPFAEDVREDALESVLTATEWARYRAAKAAGVKLIDWCDFYESVKDERILRTGKAGAESQEDVESVLNRMSLTSSQKTAIWNSYGWKAESPWS